MAKLSQNNIHTFIADKFIDNQHLVLEVRRGELTHDVIFALLFDNLRYKDGKPFGLRLTRDGFKWMKKQYEVYEISLNKQRLLGKDILYLDKYLEYPYYINEAPKSRMWGAVPNAIPKKNARLLLFAGSDTLELKLLEGNIDRWVENRKAGEELNISKC